MVASLVRTAPRNAMESGVAQRPDTVGSCARAVAPMHNRATAEQSKRRIDQQYTQKKAGQVLIGPGRPPCGCPDPRKLRLRHARQYPEIELRPVGRSIDFDLFAARELAKQNLL